MGRVTGCVREKIAQNLAQPEINAQHFSKKQKQKAPPKFGLLL
jgi:hypothetical protein